MNHWFAPTYKLSFPKRLGPVALEQRKPSRNRKKWFDSHGGVKQTSGLFSESSRSLDLLLSLVSEN